MGAICFTPPSWLLHTGADVLLTTGFQGGWSARGQAGQDITPGPRPRTDADLGLLPEVQCQCRDAELASHVAAVEIRKGDTQKEADNAAVPVPDQLWLRAFVLEYGDITCPAQVHHGDPLRKVQGEVDSWWHMVPISDKTRSRIPFCLWMERIMFRRVNFQHRTKGWLFETGTGARAKFGKYNPTFQTLVSQARITNSRLVPQSIKAEDFSLWRLPRRGAVLETTQRGVDSKVLELINRWRTKELAKGSVPNLPMRQVYTEVKSTLPTMLEYS
jgi:hypothetical protein